MRPAGPKTSNDEMYLLLKDENIEKFNQLKAEGRQCDLRGLNLRGLDMRGMDVRGLDFSDCYMRGADLRGLDLSTCRMEGASINNANISGAYFPKELSATEIMLSLNHGCRMRYTEE